jgi:chromosome segregation ATPase
MLDNRPIASYKSKQDTKHRLKPLESQVEELKDIIDGLEQRINFYKSKLQELQKKREKLDDEVRTIKKYLELAETLYRVEVDKAKIANLSSQIISDGEKTGKALSPLVDVTDQSREILLGRSKYVGLSVPQAAYLLLRESDRPMHAKEIYQKLAEGGIKIRGKTPVTSIAISLNRDKRFKRVAPNTFAAEEERNLQSA